MSLIDEAIAAGKFPESRLEHYARLLVHDPRGTKRLIASLAAAPEVLTPHAASGATRQEPSRSDAGRRIVASERGGYVVVREPECLAASSSSTAAAPPRDKSGVIKHKSSFAIPLSESDEPVSRLDYLKGNGPPTLEARAAELEAAADTGTGALPAGWFPQYRDEPRVQNRD